MSEQVPSILGIASIFLSWRNHLPNLGAACGGAARSGSPAPSPGSSSKPWHTPVLRGCSGTDHQEEEERAGPSWPTCWCRSVQTTPDHQTCWQRTTLWGSGKAAEWEMQWQKCPALRAEGEGAVLAPEVPLPAASLLAPPERKEPSLGLVLR